MPQDRSNPKNVAPCDGPDSGNFAFLDITQFGSLRLGTNTRCTGDTIDRLARNIMEGADHFLDAAPDPGATPLIDRDECTDGDFAVEPYTITTETGNKTGVLHDGLVTGLPADGIPGRLTVGTNTIEISGYDIDNTPLWAFLNDDGKALCGTPSDKAEMVACLVGWKPGNGVIFDLALDASPRWAWVPLFWENDLGSGNTDRTIREFRPVYLQTTLWKCNASSCSVVHEAGEMPVGSGSNLEIEALSALQVPLGALPTAMQKAQPGTDGDREFLLIR